MPWSISYLKEKEVVVVQYVGIVTNNDIAEGAKARIEVQKTRNTKRVLITLLEIESVETTIIDAHSLPNKLYEQLGADRQSKVALVSPSSGPLKMLCDHYENASINRGWNVKVFFTEQEAFKWLTK